MRTLIGRNFSQIAMKGDETMNICRHPIIICGKCADCGEPVNAAEQPVKPQEAPAQTETHEQPDKAQETPKRGRKRNG